MQYRISHELYLWMNYFITKAKYAFYIPSFEPICNSCHCCNPSVRHITM